MKRVAVLADLHASHKVGLTHPRWQERKQNKWLRVQKACWDFYSTEIKKLAPFDFVICNGDAVEGRGEKSGGTELICVDRHDQVEMAIAALEVARSAKTKFVFTFGTPYHTGCYEDWERDVAKHFNAHIGSHDWYDINGVCFDVKHHCGSSASPAAEHGPIARERLHNLLWAEHRLQPKGDVLIRSHVHYFQYAGNADWFGCTTPALQGYGSKFGARRCSRRVDFGFIVFEVDEKGNYVWQVKRLLVDALRARAIKL